MGTGGLIAFIVVTGVPLVVAAFYPRLRGRRRSRREPKPEKRSDKVYLPADDKTWQAYSQRQQANPKKKRRKIWKAGGGIGAGSDGCGGGHGCGGGCGGGS